MAEPRFQRRKEDRPAEITQAALAAFADKGYAATRVDEVAKRAGISKGLTIFISKPKKTCSRPSSAVSCRRGLMR